MGADRREFLGSLLAVGVTGALGGPAELAAEVTSRDTGWLKRIRGKHRAVFDNPSDDGTGVIRAWIWQRQCEEVLGAKPHDCTAVVVLRHAGVRLAMDDGYWDKYELAMSGSTPEKPNIPKHNPQMAAVVAQAGSAMYPPPAKPWIQGMGLDALLAKGAVVVACEFAFWAMINRVVQREKVDEARAREIAGSHLVPGVSLVPSGFFALAAAQNKDCAFVTNA